MDEDTSCDRNDLCKHVFNGCKDGARIPLFAAAAFTAAFVVVVLFNVNRPSNGERERGLEVGAGDDGDDGFLLSFVDDDDALIVLYKLSRVLFLEELAMDGRADGRSKRESIPKPLSNVKTTTTDALAMLCAMREV